MRKVLISITVVLALSLSSFGFSANTTARMKANQNTATTALEKAELMRIYNQCKRESLYEAQSEDTKHVIRDACTDLAVKAVKEQNELEGIF